MTTANALSFSLDNIQTKKVRVGVMNNVNIEPFTSPLYPLILLGVVSVLVLIGSDMFMLRRMKIDPHIQR